MFEKEIEELFELSMRAVNETNCFVNYSIAAHTKAIYVDISDKNCTEAHYGDGAKKGNIDQYTIYFDGTSAERSREEYVSAKAHLLRLLANGKCPLNLKEE